MRDEVAGPNPSPLEKLPAERVAIYYLHVQYHEATYQNVLALPARPGGYANMQELMTASLKRIETAERRYLAAIRTLAQVQRMKLPAAALQVNHVNSSGQHVHAETVALLG